MWQIVAIVKVIDGRRGPLPTSAVNREAADGIYYAPLQSKFGPAPVTDEVLLQAFLGGTPFLISGPPRWNPLGLGSTAVFAAKLVYNTQRTGKFALDGRRFLLRRVTFPQQPSPEWFAVDLVRHHGMEGVALSELRERLGVAIREHRYNTSLLHEMARTYGTIATLAVVDECMMASLVRQLMGENPRGGRK